MIRPLSALPLLSSHSKLCKYIALFSRQTFVRQTSAGRSAAVKAKEARSSDGGLNNNGGNNPADDGWDFLNSDDVRMVDVYAFGISLWEIWLNDVPYSNISLPVNDLLDAVVEGLRPDTQRLPEIISVLAEQCWSLSHQRPSFKALVTKFQNMPHDLNIATHAKSGTWWPF